MLIEGFGFILLPIAFVTIILALVIVIFARDRATALLRSFYGYGVIIVSFIGVAISAIVLLNTLLNTTIFPSHSSDYNPQYFKSTSESYGPKYEAGVREYLLEQQKQFDQEADRVAQEGEWRETVAVALPILVVLLPLLYFFSRRFFAKDESEEITTQTSHGAIRSAYIYVISYLSLIAMVLGGIGVLNALLQASLLSSQQTSYDVRGLLSKHITEYSYDATAPNGTAVVTRAEAESAVKAAQAELVTMPEIDAKTALNSRNRALSLSFSFLIIGGVLYFVHRTRKL